MTRASIKIGHGQFLADGTVIGGFASLEVSAEGPGAGELLQHAVGILGRTMMLTGAPPRPAQQIPQRVVSNQEGLRGLSEYEERVLATLRHVGPTTCGELAKHLTPQDYYPRGYAANAGRALRYLFRRALVKRVAGDTDRWEAV